MITKKLFIVIAMGVLLLLGTASADAALLYGTESNTGDIHQIDTVTQTSTFVFSTSVSPTSGMSPNGNAYDAVNDRIYYAPIFNSVTPSDLYFYNGSIQVFSGQLDSANAGADFYNGKYYYVMNGTDDLRVVSFNADGTIASETSVSLMTGGAKGLGFGDIAIRSDGVIFGSAADMFSGLATEFFSFDLNTNTYTVISSLSLIQLAFGSDGVLYGHQSGSGEFYTIDTTNGTSNFIFTGRFYTDLASVPLIPPEEECGNGIIESGEECDDGNQDNFDECRNDCTLPFCGDGILDPGEECEDGNTIDGDGCSANCTIEPCATCGNGILEPGEECDDGNTVGGDGCSAVCTIERGLEGCTHGYWKQEQHFNSWTAPYTPGTLFSDVFENAFSGMTLLEVLWLGDGDLNALGRETVAALLNAASPGVNYNLTTTAVITMFNDVFPGGDYELLKDTFQSFNEQGCPLN